MKESDFQSSIIKELKNKFPECIILKNDPSYKQGVPDLIALYKDAWATLECKKDKNAKHQPNQDYYVDLMNKMSFSSFLYPENKQEVLHDLERFFMKVDGRSYMIWKDFSKCFKDGEHAFLGASQHAWCNYDDEKLVKVFINKLAAKKGTILHDIACRLIKEKITLPEDGSTLSLYVNDSIKFNLRPEEKLHYSKYAFGTADAINFEDGILRVSDLKTGKTKVSFLQLKIYVVLFLLCYPEISLKCIKRIELRIYQNNNVYMETPEIDEILPLKDKMQRNSKILEELEETYNV